MKRFLCVNTLCVALLVTLGACFSGNSPISSPPTVPGDLIVEGDESFHGPHGGQFIAVVVLAFNSVLTGAEGTISPDESPAFSFVFPGLLLEGMPYEVRYWIDSNEGGGSEGACDPAVNDHQWTTGSFQAPGGNVVFPEHHNDSNIAEFCGSFGVF